ncbi:hypothetical protein D3C81_1082790 [compost metagenome]
MNDADAQRLTVAQSLERSRRAIEDNFTGEAAMRINAAEDLHQGRFASAILAADRMDFTIADLEVDPTKCLHRAEAFLDITHIENCFCHFSLLPARTDRGLP